MQVEQIIILGMVCETTQKNLICNLLGRNALKFQIFSKNPLLNKRNERVPTASESLPSLLIAHCKTTSR